MPRPQARFRRLRRWARLLVLQNGALCDELARIESKWLQARCERRFLLARLLRHRAAAAATTVQPPARAAHGGAGAGALSCWV